MTELHFWVNRSFKVSNMEPTGLYWYYAFKSSGYTFMASLISCICAHNFSHALLYFVIFQENVVNCMNSFPWVLDHAV